MARSEVQVQEKYIQRPFFGEVTPWRALLPRPAPWCCSCCGGRPPWACWSPPRCRWPRSSAGTPPRGTRQRCAPKRGPRRAYPTLLPRAYCGATERLSSSLRVLPPGLARRGLSAPSARHAATLEGGAILFAFGVTSGLCCCPRSLRCSPRSLRWAPLSRCRPRSLGSAHACAGGNLPLSLALCGRLPSTKSRRACPQGRGAAARAAQGKGRRYQDPSMRVLR